MIEVVVGTAVTVSGLIVSYYKIKSEINKSQDERIALMLSSHCPIIQEKCNERFDKLEQTIKEHSPNGELETISKIVKELKDSLL